MLRQNLWVRYINLPFALFWASGIRLPFDPRPLFWCSLLALAGNLIVHAIAVRTGDVRRAAFRLLNLDLATVLAAIYFTGAIMSPFVCVLPVSISTIYYLDRDMRKSVVYGGIAIAGLLLVTVTWWVRPVPVILWLPGEYLAWTVFVLVLQLIVLGGAVYASQELPGPLVEELARQEARLAEQRRQAELGTSLAEVAHEIRNPLTTIAITLEMVGSPARAPAPEARARLSRQVATASREIDRIARMLEGLLSFARERRGLLRPSAQDGQAVLTRATEFIRMKWDQRTPRVSLAIEATGRVPVWADPDALHQVLVNLLDNAIQHPHPARPQVITLLGEARGAQSVLIVRDTGQGIPPDRLKRLFHRFESGRPGGTGLGLAISRQLVADQGGTLAIESRYGEGTTVTLTVPARRPPREARPSAVGQAAAEAVQ